MTQTDAIVFVINYNQTLFRSAWAHWSATSWIPPDVRVALANSQEYDSYTRRGTDYPQQII